MMSERDEQPDAMSDGPPRGDPTDELEGRYTEVNDEGPGPRRFAGDYVRTEGSEPDETSVGDYTSTDDHPRTHDPAERRGKYVRTERSTGHHGD